MGRVLIGLVFTLHGLIHLLGFAAYLKLAEPEGIAYPTGLFGGRQVAPAPGQQGQPPLQPTQQRRWR